MDANKFSMFMTRIFRASIFIHIAHCIKEKIARGHKMTSNINDCVLFSFWARWWQRKTNTFHTRPHSLSLCLPMFLILCVFWIRIWPSPLIMTLQAVFFWLTESKFEIFWRIRFIFLFRVYIHASSHNCQIKQRRKSITDITNLNCARVDLVNRINYKTTIFMSHFYRWPLWKWSAAHENADGLKYDENKSKITIYL